MNHIVFESHRKSHYNEFEMLKKWREDHLSEDEDDDNDKNNDE